MQPKNRQVKRVRNYDETYWSKTGPLDSSGYRTWILKSVTTANLDGLAFIESVSGGSIIKGDRKSPQPWNYGYTNWELLTGSLSCTQYPSGVFPTTIRRSGPFYSSFAADPLYAIGSLGYSSNVYNSALSSLNEAVRGTLDLSIDAFQMKQTATLFRFVTQAEKLARSMRKIDLRSVSKEAANAWLLVTYGWKPLLGSIYGVADTILRNNLASVQKLNNRERDSLTTVTKGEFSLGHYGCVCPSILTVKRTYGCQIGISVLPSDNDLARWTSLNPASIGWELLPFSFVADWFLDVGSYLRNLETAFAYRNVFHSGYVSEFEKTEATFIVNGSGFSPDRSATYTADLKGTLETMQFRRKVLSSYPFPRLPRFEAKLGSSRLLSAAALLRGFIK
jgi:hypothetical protein